MCPGEHENIFAKTTLKIKIIILLKFKMSLNQVRGMHSLLSLQALLPQAKSSLKGLLLIFFIFTKSYPLISNNRSTP